MKAKPYQIKALAPQIQQGFQGALVFGTDFGIVQESSEKIAGFIVSDLHDTFCSVQITYSKIKEIPSILLDEGNAPPLMGGRKLIWLKEADNTVVEAVESYLEGVQTDAFLLVSAGNLTKSSSLRQMFEAGQKTLAIACYPDESKDVAAFIREVLGESGIRVSPEAMPLLVERLSENRLATRRELEKLINYLGNKKSVDSDDVSAVITDTQNTSMDTFCCSVATGQREVADKEYKLMLENGENPVSIIRVLFLYFNKLLDAAELMEKGDCEAALKKIMKPAQFRLESCFRQQIRIWKKNHIFKVLSLLMEAEQQVKQTGLPAEMILERIIFQIAGVAKRYKM